MMIRTLFAAIVAVGLIGLVDTAKANAGEPSSVTCAVQYPEKR